MSYLEPGTFSLSGKGADEVRQTVTLTREEAAAARRLLGKLVGDAGGDVERERGAVPPNDDVLLIARAVYQSRRKRLEHFGASLFSEPAWDMLLVLYLYGDRGDRMSVTKLAEFSEAPLTTAIRWLDYLETQRLIERHQCTHDRRKFFVNLSDRGRALLTAYFQSLIDSGVRASQI